MLPVGLALLLLGAAIIAGGVLLRRRGLSALSKPVDPACALTIPRNWPPEMVYQFRRGQATFPGTLVSGGGVLLSLAGLTLVGVGVAPVLWRSLTGLSCEPAVADVSLIRAGLTGLIGGVLLWGLTRPNPWDRVFQHTGPDPIMPPPGAPIAIPFMRYLSYLLIGVVGIVGVSANWKFALLGGAAVGAPVFAFSVLYLALGARWLPKPTEQKRGRGRGPKPWYRYFRTFGPLTRVDQWPLCFVMAWIYGCAVAGTFLLTCIML
jgi:hypothetical protein